MTVSVVSGQRELTQTLRNIKRAANKAAEREVSRAALAVKSTAVNKIQRGPATGVIYERTKPFKGTHRASAPGEPPMSDTGRLAGSVESKRQGLTAWVFTEVEYGRFLEFGTTKMDARPWLFPSLEENRARFPDQLGTAVVKGAETQVRK